MGRKIALRDDGDINAIDGTGYVVGPALAVHLLALVVALVVIVLVFVLLVLALAPVVLLLALVLAMALVVQVVWCGACCGDFYYQS